MKKYLSRLAPFAALPGVVLLLASCASISVQPGTAYATPHLPDKVYVALFDTRGAEFNVDRDAAELVAFKKNLQLMLQTGIKVDLTNRLISATEIDKNHDLKRANAPWMPENAWVIRGQFVRVNQGSRLLRGTIGFGLGGTKVETKVRVYDLSIDNPTPFLTFATTGGSNAEPGAVTAIATDPLTIAIEAVAGGAGGIAHGLTEDTKRTAREITAALSDYMYRSGWITQDQRIVPKYTTP